MRRCLPWLLSPKSNGLLESRMVITCGIPWTRSPYLTSLSSNSPVEIFFKTLIASFTDSTSVTIHTSLFRTAPGPNWDRFISSNITAVALAIVNNARITFSKMPLPLLPPPKRSTMMSKGILIAMAVTISSAMRTSLGSGSDEHKNHRNSL